MQCDVHSCGPLSVVTGTPLTQLFPTGATVSDFLLSSISAGFCCLGVIDGCSAKSYNASISSAVTLQVFSLSEHLAQGSDLFIGW